MAVPELLIDARPRPRLRQAAREFWAFRASLLAFASRNVRVRYKQTAFGVGWAVLQPLAMMTVFTIALGRLAKVPSGDIPYAAFSLSTLVPWTFLQTSVSSGSTALIDDSALMRKIYFPREVPVVAATLAAAVDFAVGLGLFFVLGPLLGAVVSPTWLLAPVLGLMLAILGVGVGSALGALNVYYRDFRYIVPFLIQVWLFATPVAYPLSIVPEKWQVPYVLVNPAAGLIDGFARVLAYGQPPSELTGLSLASSVVVLALGYRLFKRLEPGFADVI
jgi:ABC-type polysaccharide/polyol phosphate export permease